MTDPRTYGLTTRAVELLAVIREWVALHGCPPTYDQMAEAVGMRSRSGMHRLVNQLEERGLIRRLPKKRQSIKLVELASVALPLDVDGILRATAKHAGRTPSEHAAVLIRDNCPPLQPF